MSDQFSDLEKLLELRNKGILTQDEYEKKKASILGEPGPFKSESTLAPSWKPGSMVGLVLLSLFVPVAGIVLGIVGVAKRGKRTSQGIALLIISAFSFIVYVTIISSPNGPASKTAAISNMFSSQNAQKSTPETASAIGQVVHTGDLDVKVNSVGIFDWVNTGNEFSDLKPEQGIRYLIVDVTFKNVSGAAKTLFDGTLIVSSGSQTYKMDQSETILIGGWGLLLDKLNPLVSKNTKLVYKLGAEMKGMAYYQPHGTDQAILLGNL